MNEKLRPLVLIYEPNVELHTTLTHAFKQFDIDVEFVTELNKLLPAVLKRKPNAVVIREPEIDTAVGICRTLRAASNSGGFVIVIQSESKDIRAKMDVLEAGGDEHVSLSTDPREVALKVFRLITKNPRVPFSQEDGPTGSIGEVTIADLLEIFNANKWTGKA
ncbi:MAG TPA: response regulator transcription factor, partial [Archaeoglobus sp.]|nr:response regulator transcription factor [Archaeoglobus sp.]